MNQPYLTDLTAWDAGKTQESQQRYKKWITVLEAALDIIIQGFTAIATAKPTPESDVERARLSLIVRAFRSIHASLIIAKMAYYQQAVMLARAAMEDLLMAEVADRHHLVLEALNNWDADRAPRFGRGELTTEKLTDFLPETFKPIWIREYSDASKLGTHPGSQSVDTQMILDDEQTLHLPLFSELDDALALACLGFIAGRCRRMIYVLNLLTDKETEWMASGRRATAEIDDMMKELVQEMAKALEG